MALLDLFRRSPKTDKARIEPSLHTNLADDDDNNVESSSAQSAAASTEKKQVEFLRRTGKYTKKEHAQQYQADSSFIDKLPYTEFLDDQKMLLLEDGRSVGAVYELTMIPTEGRSRDFLNELRTQVTDALQDAFPELDTNPWVVQFYCQDDEMAMDYEDVLRHYVRPNARGTEFTEKWLSIMGKHLRDVSKPGGLFEDTVVTGTQWRGQQRRVRMVIYRYVPRNTSLELSVEGLATTCEGVENALFATGVRVKRLDGRSIHEWLLRWFNPKPDLYDDQEMFYRTCHYTVKEEGEGSLYLANDFAETLFVKPPENRDSLWYFDGLPHDVVVVDSIRRPPQVGLLTGEVQRGDKFNSLFDLLPENTVMVMTMVVYPQDMLDQHLSSITESALGDNTDSQQARLDATRVREILIEKHKLYRSSLAFYLRADEPQTLRRNSRRLRAMLQSAGLIPVQEGTEIAPLNSYLRWLPMNFNPSDDRKNLYTKFNWVQHIANLLPLFGRSIGTRHPGITYFNRGGSPLDFDPLNKEDRSKAAHALILGPTGAGKSATLNGKIAQLMAMHRPRLFVIEAGNSFGLISEYLERYGLTVNRIQLKPGAGISLPLFADCHQLLTEEMRAEIDTAKLSPVESGEYSKSINAKIKADIEWEAKKAEMEPEIEAESDVEEDDQRDILGEMELTVRLLVTGGEAKEDDRLTRPDKAMIRKAILLAASNTYAAGRMTLTRDIRDAFYAMRDDQELSPEKQRRAEEMGDSVGMFCEPGSFEAELFDREGEIWPEADVTIVDLATLAREGYEAQLAIAYISLINHINSLGEKHQFSGRPIVNITDEAHIITVNAMLARFLIKAGKMWRKLGIWLWLATQNLKDFPKDAEKLLSMLEFWELLCLEKAEVAEVVRFKSLTEAQVQLITSVRKENRKYTEGVLLSSKQEALFRVVPPSIYLALAMTEPEEKAERAELMRKFGISELDAALKVAENIDRARGILH